MQTTITQEDPIAMRVNGTTLPATMRSEIGRFDLVLRGIAMSDSPVLVRADRDDDRITIVARLHALGRRSTLALHYCSKASDALALLRAVLHGVNDSDVSGTWALHGVSNWKPEEQRVLANALAALDEHRLEQRMHHALLPRIIVLEACASETLDPVLAKRLAFFEIALGAPAQPQKKASRKKQH